MCKIKLIIEIGNGETAIGIGKFKDSNTSFLGFKPLQEKHEIGQKVTEEVKGFFDDEYIAIEIKSKEAFMVLKEQILEIEKRYFNDQSVKR